MLLTENICLDTRARNTIFSHTLQTLPEEPCIGRAVTIQQLEQEEQHRPHRLIMLGKLIAGLATLAIGLYFCYRACGMIKNPSNYFSKKQMDWLARPPHLATTRAIFEAENRRGGWLLGACLGAPATIGGILMSLYSNQRWISQSPNDLRQKFVICNQWNNAMSGQVLTQLKSNKEMNDWSSKQNQHCPEIYNAYQRESNRLYQAITALQRFQQTYVLPAAQ